MREVSAEYEAWALWLLGAAAASLDALPMEQAEGYYRDGIVLDLYRAMGRTFWLPRALAAVGRIELDDRL